MIKTNIVDSKNSNELTVEDNGAINVYVIPRPPFTINEVALPLVEFLKLNGTGTTSFVIDGSVTNRDFFVAAKDYDTYINTIVFEIADAGAVLNQFGALAPLTNGLDFYYFNSSSGKYIIEEGLKTNYSFVKLANFEPSFGTGAAAFQLTNAISASEAYVGVIDLEDVFGLQWGLKLRADTTDRIGFTVKDSLTGLDQMTIKVYGIRLPAK